MAQNQYIVYVAGEKISSKTMPYITDGINSVVIYLFSILFHFSNKYPQFHIIGPSKFHQPPSHRGVHVPELHAMIRAASGQYGTEMVKTWKQQ